MIADALTARGIEVRHIMTGTKADLHKLTSFARVEAGRVTYPPPSSTYFRRERQPHCLPLPFRYLDLLRLIGFEETPAPPRRPPIVHRPRRSVNAGLEPRRKHDRCARCRLDPIPRNDAVNLRRRRQHNF